MTKWNIWRIKNRWLRAAVAWPVTVIGAVVLAVIFLVSAPIFAVKGVWEGFAAAFDKRERDEWVQVFADLWSALTAKDEPV